MSPMLSNDKSVRLIAFSIPVTDNEEYLRQGLKPGPLRESPRDTVRGLDLPTLLL